MKYSLLSLLAVFGLALTTHANAENLAPQKSPIVSPLAPSHWAGPYAGLNVGYGWSNPSTVHGAEYALPPLRRTGATGSAWSLQSPNMNGFFGGVQIGYNYQIMATAFVVGAETDFQGSGLSGTTSGIGSKNITGRYFPYVSTNQSVDWFGTIRGRIGYAVLPSLLAYGTGGFAYGGGKNSFSVLYSDFYDIGNSSGSYARTGWTAGGGVEWALWNNITMKTEYLYVDLGQTTSLSAQQYCLCSGRTIPKLDYFMANQSGGSNRFHTLRAGLNYHFNWAPSPDIRM